MSKRTRPEGWINPLGATVEEAYEQARREDAEFREVDDRLAVAEAIAEKIILGRTFKGYTQDQLAELIGTKGPDISRIEKGDGKYIPNAVTLQKLGRVLGVTFEFPTEAPMQRAEKPRITRASSSAGSPAIAYPMAASAKSSGRPPQ